jgi:hypothetical protein
VYSLDCCDDMAGVEHESSLVITPFPPALYNSRRDKLGRLDSRTPVVFHVSCRKFGVDRGRSRCDVEQPAAAVAR